MTSSAGTASSADVVIADTRRWLERAVIGLNLCPFAKAVHSKGLIHYAVSAAGTPEQLLQDLISELEGLQARAEPERETTLLIAPKCLAEFLDFNDFLVEADDALVELGLEGAIQIASFHPRYRFAGTAADDIANATNHAPYPTLHLLREASIERAVEAFADPGSIYQANIETLTRLGAHGWAALGVGASDEKP